MRVHLKGVHTVRKRLAKGGVVTYHYAWRGGPRLTGEPGSAEFLSAYNAAYSSRSTSASGTLSQLICEFRKSAEFGRLAGSTQGDYRRYLAIIESAFGDLPLSGVTFHDLRGSAVTRLAEAGATHAEIVAITGHSHRDAGDMMDKHYLSPTKELARSGIRRLELKSKQERKL